MVLRRRTPHGIGHRMPTAGAIARDRRRLVQSVPPPLQPDLTHHRLADESRNTRDLAGKRRQRDQILPDIAWAQQSGKITIPFPRTCRQAYGIAGG